ncbi:MAG: hypothetical protein JHD07_13725 [Bradyrhizobium sp.]|uniref:hypothetical protein n=1 Tax=Bradyrhizobium sp. TaxID=376 RepID=UPI001A2B623E|nr:hypothetical protein [Bradyrhizobium sp.]MBJ7404290.1 hypothetical protein [Bradyrhizobium sp.]
MLLRDAVFAWTPVNFPGKATSGQIRVGPLDGSRFWKVSYAFTRGADIAYWKDFSDERRLFEMLFFFNLAVTRDGLAVSVVHDAFKGIDEYERMHSVGDDD